MITKEELLQEGWGYDCGYDNYTKGQYWGLKIYPYRIEISHQGNIWYYGICENINDLNQIERLVRIS